MDQHHENNPMIKHSNPPNHLTGHTESLTGVCNCSSGTGSPEGAVTGGIGDLYTQVDGTGGRTLWQKRFASVAGSTSRGWSLMQGSLALFNVADYGARGDGITDDRLAIQTAVDEAKAIAGTVYFPPGKYLVQNAIRLTDDKHPITQGIRLQGPASMYNYNQINKPAILVAGSSFPTTGEAVLDLRFSQHTAVVDLGIDGSQISESIGIRLGSITDGVTYPLHLIYQCSIVNCAYGVRARNAGLLSVRHCSIAGWNDSKAKVGVLLEAYCGDSDFEGNYINTFHPDRTSSGVWEGSGMVIGSGSGNVNVRGGKIEWNAKGVVVDGSVGVTIVGVSFDVNRWAHVVVLAEASAGYLSGNGITIVGNRFLAGGTYRDSATNIGQSAIQVLVPRSDTKASVAIVGNTIHKGGDLAYDFNTGPNIGPKTYGIGVEGDGEGIITIVGNDMLDASTNKAIGAYGPFVIEAIGNSSNLSNYFDHGARLQATSGGQVLTSGVSADRGDNNVSLQVGIDKRTQRFASNLTTNRTVTLSATNAVDGARFRIVRTGSGPGTLNVGGLKTIPATTRAFVDVEFDGTTWLLTGYGLL